MAKKYVCLKQGCRFVTESEYESEQHQKTGPGHNIYEVDMDWNGKIVRTEIDQDME